MSEYPEHEKLAAVKDRSQAIGEFLDYGLQRQGLALYERAEVPCECSLCRNGRTRRDYEHRDAVRTEDGVAYFEQWWPTHKSITAILADWFGIDQARLDAEKEAMLAALRAASGACTPAP